MSNDKIDAMINRAKARVNVREGSADEAKRKVVVVKGVGGRARLSDAEREARKEKLEAERAERKAARMAKLAESKAAKEALKATHKPHMKKIETAAAKLPALDTQAELILNEAKANLSAGQLVALAAHIELHNRIAATERAMTQKLEIGDRVRVVGGNARYLGMEGVVSEAKRIRCFVDIDGVDRPVYLFTSDVEILEAAGEESFEEAEEDSTENQLEATGTEG